MDLKDVLRKKKEYAERAAARDTDRPKIDYFSLKDNNPAKIVFLQELDGEVESDANAKGTPPALFLVEHVSPHNWKRKAKCTIESQGRCFACEMAQEEPKLENGSWWAKTNMYIQVFNEKDGKVNVLSRPVNNKDGSFFDLLYNWAVEENNGSITNQTFTISKGSEKTSSWQLMSSNKKLDVDAADLLDLEQVIGIEIDYEKQRNFYIPADADEAPAKEKPAQKAKSTTESEW